LPRRVHTSIDKLPADLRSTITAMVVDGQWPGDWPKQEGKPTYLDMVKYAGGKGYALSRSAVGRWAKTLLVYERFKTTGAIAREICKGMSDEKASATQKAAAEIITAQVIDLASGEDLTSKQIKEVATAIRDCTSVAMQADKYIRQQLAEKAKSADATVTAIVKKKRIDPETLKLIREQIYGIVA
jgi:hypothetical protein